MRAGGNQNKLIHGYARHDGSSPPEYLTWVNIRRRCRDKSRKYYQGRGITVCPEWEESFEAFYRDMGPRPSDKHSIDRIDGEKGYSPENCRWATAKTQNRNRSCVRPVVRGDGRYFATMQEGAEAIGLTISAVYRACNGKSPTAGGFTWAYAADIPQTLGATNGQ